MRPPSSGPDAGRSPQRGPLDDEGQAQDPGATAARDVEFVRDFVRRTPGSEARMTERLAIVPRILRALNARSQAPLGEHDLADLVQDTLTIVLRKLDRFDGRTALDAWLYGICFYELKNAGRRAHRRHLQADGLEAELSDEAEGGDREVDRIADDVRRGLATLDDDERPVVRLKHFDSLTFDQIGERMGISPNTAKTRYYRGLAKLKQYMAPRRQEYRA